MSQTSKGTKILIILVAAVLLMLAVLVLRSPKDAPSDESVVDSKPPVGESALAPPPESDPLTQLPPSPLNELLEEGLTPEAQTTIVGNFLLDYWITNRSLPVGTPEEMQAALQGANAKEVQYLIPNHPTLSARGFQAKGDESEVILHVLSSREGSFELIYTGEDAEPYTDDDLIRPFPR